MKFKKILGLLLACMAVAGCFGVPAGAQEAEAVRLSEMACLPLTAVDPVYSGEVPVSRASGSVNTTVSAEKMRIFSSDFSLDAGETVTINCSYAPASASVDFGLIAPNGHFYYINVTSGSINKTIQIEERGTYTLAVRNNSSSTVTVIGTVYY